MEIFQTNISPFSHREDVEEKIWALNLKCSGPENLTITFKSHQMLSVLCQECLPFRSSCKIPYLLCFCPFFILRGVKICSAIKLLSLPKWMVVFSICRCLLVFTWSQRHCHFQIVYVCVTDTLDFLIVSAKAHCHQSNVSRSPQSGEIVWEKEKLYSGEKFAIRETQPQKCATLRQRGGQLIQRKCLPWSLTSFASMQMRFPNLHRLIGPQSTVMIGWNHASGLAIIKLLWLVNKDVTKI